MPLAKKAVKKAKKKAVTKKKISAVKKTIKKRAARKETTGAKPRRKTTPRFIKEQTIEQKVEAAKYYTSEPKNSITISQSDYSFPAGYGDNRIVLMVRDPYWTHTYWEISGQRMKEIVWELGEEVFHRSQKILRVYDTGSWHYFDVDINDEAINWYLKMPEPNHSYCVEIGFKTPDGRFVSAARSNWVTMPRDKASDVIDPNWVPGDWDNIYSLSGGYLARTGSFGWLSSFSLPRH